MTPDELRALGLEKTAEYEECDPEDVWLRRKLADAMRAELLERIELLNQFCYECKHLDGWAWCRESGLTEQRGQRDHCLFTPSRWERRDNGDR